MRRAPGLAPRFVHTHTRYRSVIFASLIAFFDFARRISLWHHANLFRSSYLYPLLLRSLCLINTSYSTSCRRALCWVSVPGYFRLSGGGGTR